MSGPNLLRGYIIDAAREFNAGRYFEAHEMLEEGLDAVPDAVWNLFIGLIQIAVGYHKVTQQRWNGAAHMLEIGLQKIAPFGAEAAGVKLEGLRQRATADLAQLRRGSFDAAVFSQNPPRLIPSTAVPDQDP